MKKILKSRTTKVLSIFSMFAIAALPVLANATSDGNNGVNSSAMSPAAIVGSVALIIGIVVVLSAKGARRVSH